MPIQASAAARRTSGQAMGDTNTCGPCLQRKAKINSVRSRRPPDNMALRAAGSGRSLPKGNGAKLTIRARRSAGRIIVEPPICGSFCAEIGAVQLFFDPFHKPLVGKATEKLLVAPREL